MKLIYFFLLLWICALPLQAQKTAAKDTLLNREMTLEKEYSPTIEKAAKINQLPELREPQAPKSIVEFSNYSTAYKLQNGLASLMPKSMLTDLNTSKYAGYANFSVSTLADFDGDAAYQILNTGHDYLDVYFTHRSSNSKNPSLQVPGESQKFFMNDNWGGFNFSHNFDKVKLLADMKYTYSSFNYSRLAITNLDQIMSSSIWSVEPIYAIQNYPANQTNNMFEAHAGVVSETPGALNYKVNLRYTYFKQKYTYQQAVPGVGENRVIIDWNLYQNYNATSGFGLGGFYKTYKYSSEEFRIYGENDKIRTYSALSLNPYYRVEGDNLNLTLGIRADFELGGRKKAVVAPNIRFNYNPSDAFTFYALALGGRNDNSNYDMFYENRYVFPLERVSDSRTYLDGTVGLRYLPVSNISLDIFTGYKITKDEHFFRPLPSWSWDDSSLAGMSIMPDYGMANVAKIGAQINYTLQDLLGVNVKGTFYNWDVTGTGIDADGNETKYDMEAWHKPQFELGMDVYFRTPNIPLRIDLDFKGLFGRKMVEPLYATSYFTMKDVYDLSVKTSYAITPYFSACLSTNNLLFQKYDIWYGYPAQKFDIMGGISVMF